MKVHQINENSLMVTFGDQIDLTFPAKIKALSNKITDTFKHDVIELTPSYTTLLVEFGFNVKPQTAIAIIERFNIDVYDSTPVCTVTIPVFYHTSVAPHLDEICETLQLSVQALIDLHTRAPYTCCAIGFLPGFGFLAELPPSLQLPRLATPRSVIAGSVAIAERQTAIYPSDSPGGWHVIGRCPLDLFDPQHPDKSLLKVGDQVQFTSISQHEYHQYQDNAC
ncbi:5-oxoprolinase subunit B family protein [Thaumasiovibrio sp. DFM-14]|uniref:5-oxoprolinase subunit B family protein n=1 Tax=Thaumasiovibrio sp. DFM-14 TaxID=3384792 RepID=UPI0039A34BEF